MTQEYIKLVRHGSGKRQKKFAVVDYDGLAIYGIGSTRQGALEDAIGYIEYSRIPWKGSRDAKDYPDRPVRGIGIYIREVPGRVAKYVETVNNGRDAVEFMFIQDMKRRK